MNKFEEYKKLRRQGYGYKAAIAKRQIDLPKPSFVYDTSEMTQKPLVVKKDGFVFHFSLHEDHAGVLLSDLGYFTDTYEEGSFAHEQHNSGTYNWFVPKNFTPPEWFARQGMSKNDAHVASYKEARRQFELGRSYGVKWSYCDVRGRVYVDCPELDKILLAADLIECINVPYDMEEADAKGLSAIIDEQIHRLLPKASSRLSEMHKALCALTITPKKVYDKRVKELADELENFAATFLTMGGGYEITEEEIKKWTRQTRQMSAEDLGDELDLAPSGRTIPDWLEEVDERAADLADYYQI